MALKRLSSNAFKIETGVLDGLAGLFILIFIGVTAYWVYEVYELYETPIAVDNTDLIAHNTAHAMAAFQAAVLSFFMALLALRLGKRV